MERRDQRRDDADLRAAEAGADREDEQRRRDRERDLRQSDDEPRAAERPVHAGEEPGVERLRVRRRDARQEAEGAAVDERLRERSLFSTYSSRIDPRSIASTSSRGSAATAATPSQTRGAAGRGIR